MSEPIDNKITDEAVVSLYSGERFKELIEAGVFFGRKRTKTNPRMRPYILVTRNEMEIINLEKTLEGLEQALLFLKEKIRGGGSARSTGSADSPQGGSLQPGSGQARQASSPQGGNILLVGTQPQAVEGVVKLAKEFNMPFVTARWLGGLLTNFKIISKRNDYYKKLKDDLRTGGLEKYTKKERLGFEREIRRLEELFGGLENYLALPDALLMIDPNIHMTAVREAKRLKIPIIAYVNTDIDPDLAEYSVIGNTKARKSVNWFLEKAAEAMREAKALHSAEPKESVETAEKMNQAAA
ncbi:MAG: 30S ribosomal protein S2 [Candidatus Liptonbacteria bacterium]|nr:30S ribosomal protein S2 [Candidatus Liptonbacteria bacterium]